MGEIILGGCQMARETALIAYGLFGVFMPLIAGV
jgi:hypothetical protein